MAAPELEHLHRAIAAIQKSIKPEPYPELDVQIQRGEDVLAQIRDTAKEASQPLDAPYDLNREE